MPLYEYRCEGCGARFEMMQPLWKLFESTRAQCEARAKLYYNADGVYYPETMTPFGTRRSEATLIADPLGDLRLRHVFDEAHVHDQPLALRQCLQRRRPAGP